MPHSSFIVFSGFQMLAYVLAAETLRLANKCQGEALFSWETRTPDGTPARASSGVAVVPDRGDWEDTPPADLLLVFAGYNPPRQVPSGLRRYLARAAQRGAVLGGVDTGTFVLAGLGYLQGRAVVVHHEAEAAFREAWPDIPIARQIYQFDGERLSAAGGTAMGDAMLAWIAATSSTDLARATSRAMLHGAIRPASVAQQEAPTRDPLLEEMGRLMESHLETPLPISAIAARLGLSQKQLRQRCQRLLGFSPSLYYQRLRLRVARDLLLNSRMPMTDIAIATGFASQAAFSRAFRQAFQVAPGRLRRAADDAFMACG